MPAKKRSAKGQAGKKAAIKSSGKKSPSLGNFPAYGPDNEAPVIVKGGPQLLSDGGGKGWSLSSVTPLDFTFDMQSSALPNTYSQSTGAAITGFTVVSVRDQRVVFCYNSAVDGDYEIIFGSPECD